MSQNISRICAALRDEIEHDNRISNALVDEVEALMIQNAKTRGILFARLKNLLGIQEYGAPPAEPQQEPTMQEILARLRERESAWGTDHENH